jgi:pimeloyl-ACP methyl ester carboxylesterase
MTDATSIEAPAPAFLELEDLPGERIAYSRLPATRPGRPGLVFLGGFMSDMTGTKATALEAYAERSGLAFVRFDYRGHGSSSGRFEEGTIGAWTADATQVLDRLTEGPQILIGSSMGKSFPRRPATRSQPKAGGRWPRTTARSPTSLPAP